MAMYGMQMQQVVSAVVKPETTTVTESDKRDHHGRRPEEVGEARSLKDLLAQWEDLKDISHDLFRSDVMEGNVGTDVRKKITRRYKVDQVLYQAADARSDKKDTQLGYVTA